MRKSLRPTKSKDTHAAGDEPGEQDVGGLAAVLLGKSLNLQEAKGLDDLISNWRSEYSTYELVLRVRSASGAAEQAQKPLADASADYRRQETHRGL